MVNMTNLIKQHNARVLESQEHMEKRSCNCIVKDNYLLDGKCLHECIVYQANIIKGSVRYIFTSLFCMSKREDL